MEVTAPTTTNLLLAFFDDTSDLSTYLSLRDVLWQAWSMGLGVRDWDTWMGRSGVTSLLAEVGNGNRSA
jgi:hypothetical protein